jgi:phenylacetate-CoA ligase
VFPSQIEEVLLEVEGILPHYQIVLERDAGIDTMEIQVEASKDLPTLDEIKQLERFRYTIEEYLNNSLGFRPIVTLVEPKTLLRSTGGKIKRVIDNREL